MKAEILLSTPLEEVLAEQERVRQQKEERIKIKQMAQKAELNRQNTLVMPSSGGRGFDYKDTEEQEMVERQALDFALDGRLILKDRALKNQELDFYNQIDKLRPDTVDYLVRKQEDEERAKEVKLNPIKEINEDSNYLETDSELQDEKVFDHFDQNDGGEFWEDIETKIKHVPDGLQLPQTVTTVNGIETDPANRLVAQGKLSVVITPSAGGDIKEVTSMNDVKDAYAKDSQIAMDQNQRDVEGTIAHQKIQQARKA